MNKKKKSRKLEFSKSLLIQESVLIWITTLAMLVLAFLCIFYGYMSDLPWLAVMAGLPWGAYAVSQHAYYKKSQAENTQKGIKYESLMAQLNQNQEEDEPLG